MASILIIDDEPEVLRVLKKVLEGAGHSVTEAADGKTALRWFAGRPTDLVVTDIYMPEMDGLEFLMRLREAFPETPVVAISGGGHLVTSSLKCNSG
jgi:CheY-like chemotaxis protein